MLHKYSAFMLHTLIALVKNSKWISFYVNWHRIRYACTWIDARMLHNWRFPRKVLKVTCANNVFIMETLRLSHNLLESTRLWLFIDLESIFFDSNFQLNKSITKCQSWKSAAKLLKGIARGMSIARKSTRRKVRRCVTDFSRNLWHFLPSSICILYWFFKCLQL